MQHKSTPGHWDRAWGKRSGIPTDHHAPIVTMLAQHVGPLNEKRILEVGAGSAKDSVRLAELGAKSAAIDYSAAALTIARKLSSSRSVELPLVQADTFQLPFEDGSFHAVFSQGLLEHFTEPQLAIKEQTRVLKRGGVLLVDVPQKYHPYSLYKWYQMKKGHWFAGWETSFSLNELEMMFLDNGLLVTDSYGSGYWPGALLAIRNFHTLGRRHTLRVWLPNYLTRKIEGLWERAEKMKPYSRFMWNVGIVGLKVG